MKAIATSQLFRTLERWKVQAEARFRGPSQFLSVERKIVELQVACSKGPTLYFCIRSYYVR